MVKMNCKACNKEIDYVKERQPRAFDFGTEVKHVCEGFGQKKQFTSKKAMPIEAELELLKRISELEETVSRHDIAIKSLVAQLQGQPSLG